MNGLNEQLLQLSYIRFLTLTGQAAMLVFTLLMLQAQLNVVLLSITFIGLALLNLATFARLHSRWPVTEPEFFSHLIADLILAGGLLYQTGGASNPFVFLLLIPVLISAATLSGRYCLVIATVAVAIYSSLLNHHVEIVATQNSHLHRLTHLFDLHMIGMWLNFILTAIIVSWFITRMRRSMEQQQARLEAQREQLVQDQQLVSLATMAAGTAHELGTPLSTMRILLSELRQDYNNDQNLQADLELLEQQVGLCADRLQKMSSAVRDEQASEVVMPATRLLNDALDQWQLMRPEVTFTQQCLGEGQPPALQNSTTLQQAILNLLNNAADANPEGIEITLDWDRSNVIVRIHDKGPGLSIEQAHHLGKPFITTKGRGLGIGLFMTTTTLARHNGDVRLYNHEAGGTLTEITLRRSSIQQGAF